MNGYQSHIFEHHTVPGGVAACWKRKGYLVVPMRLNLLAEKPASSGVTVFMLFLPT